MPDHPLQLGVGVRRSRARHVGSDDPGKPRLVHEYAALQGTAVAIRAAADMREALAFLHEGGIIIGAEGGRRYIVAPVGDPFGKPVQDGDGEHHDREPSASRRRTRSSRFIGNEMAGECWNR